MYKGRMTEELSKLYDEYYEMFGCDPDFYENTYFDNNNYEEYVTMIKKSLKTGKELGSFYK